MKAISYYQIHADDIIKEERLERFLPKLEDYKSGGRQDVFDNIDLLSENVRSKTRTMKNFSLFNKVYEIDKMISNHRHKHTQIYTSSSSRRHL